MSFMETTRKPGCDIPTEELLIAPDLAGMSTERVVSSASDGDSNQNDPVLTGPAKR